MKEAVSFRDFLRAIDSDEVKSKKSKVKRLIGSCDSRTLIFLLLNFDF